MLFRPFGNLQFIQQPRNIILLFQICSQIQRSGWLHSGLDSCPLNFVINAFSSFIAVIFVAKRRSQLGTFVTHELTLHRTGGRATVAPHLHQRFFFFLLKSLDP